MSLRELFKSGISFIELLNKSDEPYRNKCEEIINSIKIDEGVLNKIKSITKKVKILAFAELWCPDCQINLPAVNAMTENNNIIEFKIVPREGNENFIEKYKLDGKVKIPTLIIMDEDFNEIGSFIEVPQIVRDVVNRGNQVEIIVAKREYRNGKYITNTIEEVLDIIK
jgi:thiol-disulfide isomerase/thioredoxin